MKKIIALASAFAMMLSMAAVASAKTTPVESGFTVVYDAAKSTPTTAVVEVYAKGIKTAGTVTNLTLNFDLDTAIVDVATANANAASILTWGDEVSAGNMNKNVVNTNSRKQLYVSLVDTDGASWNENEPIVTAELPLLSAVSAKTAIMTHNTAGNRYKVTIDGVASASNYSATIDQILPMSATATGTTVNEVAGKDAATYFSVETTAVAGTPYWYATVDNAAKKTACTTANISAGTTVKLGLVSVGSVSDAKIVWE